MTVKDLVISNTTAAHKDFSANELIGFNQMLKGAIADGFNWSVGDELMDSLQTLIWQKEAIVSLIASKEG